MFLAYQYMPQFFMFSVVLLALITCYHALKALWFGAVWLFQRVMDRLSFFPHLK